MDQSDKYTPYAIDWRFLPEKILYLKDFTRHYLANLSNAIAHRRGLSPLWAASLGRRTISAISRARVLFIHVPKAGGTSISKCLYGRNLPHYSASFYRAVFPAETAGLPSFAVIRHPVERLLSAYAFLRNGGTDLMACDFHDRRRMGDLSLIDAVVDRLYAARADLSSLPSAFRRQCDYIVGDDDSIIVDRLFSLDNTSGFPPELGRWLGIPRLPRINATRSESSPISQASRHKVEEIYARDFSLYRTLVANGGHLDVKSGGGPISSWPSWLRDWVPSGGSPLDGTKP
jgi:hypothetical protein